jgi:N utilization substance protein A
MEVIVDDSQLSLAIGKKGQNVRLAAKLLGWRIDIKSEEEKRQEVEQQMALVVPGSPVSVLTDHGASEGVIEALPAAGITTVELLGEMTPEQLQEVPGIEPSMVETIQTAVVSYYGQFETVPGETSAPLNEAADGASSTPEALEEQSVRIETQESSPSASGHDAEKGE